MPADRIRFIGLTDFGRGPVAEFDVGNSSLGWLQWSTERGPVLAHPNGVARFNRPSLEARIENLRKYGHDVAEEERALAAIMEAIDAAR